jgi:hypothetical protein
MTTMPAEAPARMTSQDVPQVSVTISITDVTPSPAQMRCWMRLWEMLLRPDVGQVETHTDGT